jgi:hypothetical protein
MTDSHGQTNKQRTTQPSIGLTLHVAADVRFVGNRAAQIVYCSTQLGEIFIELGAKRVATRR